MQQGVIAEPTQDAQIIADTIAEYLKANKTFNRWFERGPIEVYVRRQKVILSRERGIADALTLARVTVEECERGKGVFKGLLTLSEELVRRYIPGGVLYIEGVGNEGLAACLERRGYTKKPIGQDAPAFYWSPR